MAGHGAPGRPPDSWIERGDIIFEDGNRKIDMVDRGGFTEPAQKKYNPAVSRKGRGGGWKCGMDFDGWVKKLLFVIGPPFL